MSASNLDIREKPPVPPQQPADGRLAFAGDARNGRPLRARSLAMMTVACVGKGGGGKSTVTVNLAVIARLLGLKVGIIDADPQRSTTEWRRARADSDIPLRCCEPNRLDETVDMARRAGIECLFVDAPPDPTLAISAIRAADVALLPTRPSLFDIKVTLSCLDLLRSVDRRHGIIINAAPPTRQGEDAPMVRDARQALAPVTKQLWRGQITHRHAIPYAITAGRGVAEIEPAGPAAVEYRALWSVVAQQIQISRSIP